MLMTKYPKSIWVKTFTVLVQKTDPINKIMQEDHTALDNGFNVTIILSPA